MYSLKPDCISSPYIFKLKTSFWYSIFLATISSSALCEERNNNLVSSIFLEYQPDYSYRGVVLENLDSVDYGIEISHLGLSAGIEEVDLDDVDNFTAYFLSYSYNFNVLNISVGFQNNDPILKSKEIFIEAISQVNETLEAKVSYFHRIDHDSSDYIEFQLSRPWVSRAGQWMAKPYALISAGDYYSDGFSFNHFEVGSDITYRLTAHLYLSAYGAVVLPLESVKDAGFESDIKVSGGLVLRYTF
ncbi:MAG: hypothetical protein R3F50_02000 [Gammaproteobacteria bacterium]